MKKNKQIVLDILLAIAFIILGTCTASAETNDTQEVTRIVSIPTSDKALSRAFSLSDDQLDYVKYELEDLEMKLRCAYSISNDDDAREKMVMWAVSNNASSMKSILNDAQYKKYLTVLNTTMKNRGIIK